MTSSIKNICVFASSSNSVQEIFYNEARELGLLIGAAGMNVVYGGSRRGLMYACAGAAAENGGALIGVMPEKLADMGFANPKDCKEFYVTTGMRERKAKMDELSDAVIAIAGGYGTLEEISEMIVQKQLGYNNKPIVILNTDNFYKSLIEFFDNTIKRNFANDSAKKLYYIAQNPQDAISYILNYVPEEIGSKFAIR